MAKDRLRVGQTAEVGLLSGQILEGCESGAVVQSGLCWNKRFLDVWIDYDLWVVWLIDLLSIEL